MDMLPTLNGHAIAVLLLTAVALLLFTRERIPLETSSLLVLVLLAVGFELFPFKHDGATLHATAFFSGFGHEALVAVCALMIAGQGLVRTGALEPFGRLLARLWGVAPALSMLLTLILGALLSAFVNNVPIVVLLLPILIGVSLRTKRPASAVLMPMGFATLIGGMSTTIGTSTNLLVVSVAADMGMERLQMFDFLLPAVMAGSLALLYLWLAAPRLIPERQPPMIEGSNRVFHAQLLIPEGNSLVGKRLTDVIRKAGGEVNIQRIGRGQDHFLTPLPDLRIEAFDRLLVADTVDRLRAHPRTLLLPHLGASTAEAEENCSVMAADQLMDFLENGNVINSVNFPRTRMSRNGGYRFTFANENVPRVLGHVLSVLADRDINVLDMVNKSRNEMAYNIIDVETELTAEVIEALVSAALEERGVDKVRVERVLSPPWTTDWITPEGREKLRLYGIAPPERRDKPIACPRCEAENTELVSEFGSTACKASYKCNACLEPFEYFKCI